MTDVASTDLVALQGSASAFIDAAKAWKTDDPDSRAAVVASAAGFSASITIVLSDHPALKIGSNVLGVGSALASLKLDVDAYNSAVLSQDPRGQNSAVLGIIADASAAGAGTTTLLTPLFPPLADPAAALTVFSSAFAAAKLGYDINSDIEDALSKLDSELRQGIIDDFNDFNSLGQSGELSNPLVKFITYAGNAAGSGNNVSLYYNNQNIVSVSTNHVGNNATAINTLSVGYDGSFVTASASFSQDTSGQWSITTSNGLIITLTGIETLKAGVIGGNPQEVTFQDGSGKQYALDPTVQANGLYKIVDLGSGSAIDVSPIAVGSIDASGEGLKIDYGNSGIFQWTPQDDDSAVGNYYCNDQLLATVQGNQSTLDQGGFGAGAPGTLAYLQGVGSNGALGDRIPYYVGDDGQENTESFSQASSAASTDQAQLSAIVPPDPESTTPISNEYFTATVASSTAPSSSGDSSADALASGTVSNGLLFNQGNVIIATGENAAGTNSIANTNGLQDSTLSGILDGYVRVAAGQDQPVSQSAGDLVAGPLTGGTLASGGLSDDQAAAIANEPPAQLATLAAPVVNQVYANYAVNAPNLVDIDPLLLDLTGDGIALTNWIGNSVFFDTNLNSVGTAADGLEHHTSWMATGTGMLVFDPTGGAITNITQTVSEDLNVGSGVGNFTDGLAALASLAMTGAAAFTAATSKIDPLTGKSYWSEIEVAQSNPSSTGVIASSQLETLAAAGITSISLQGSGNEGESIAGSPITNRSTYTYTSGGTTTTGQVAAVDFATDTTGDVTTTASGGIVVNSVPEGGASAANSYIDTNPTARSFLLSSGTLTDTTNSQVLQSGIVGFFATTENDVIRVAAGDTGNYWLGGGTGAATLDASQGSGTITFLINSQTTVHGGSGFNMAQVTDGDPITVDLKTDNLQEVIGGTGDGTFNASGTTWNVFIQGGSGNNIILGGYADDALSGGSGDDLIEGGPGGSVIHAGSGNDLIYGGSGTTAGAPNSDVIFGGAGDDTVVLGTNNSAVYAGSGSMTLIGNDNQTVPGTTTKAFSVVNFHGSYANYTLTHNADGSMTVTDNVAGQDGPVTLENVTDISFSDVSMIPLDTMGIMPANDTVVVSGNGPHVVEASTLLANDIDYAGNTLSIASLLDDNGNKIARGASGQVNGGVAALSADGSQITFTPTAGFTGLPSFRYYDQDNLGNTDINVGLSLNNTATGNNALIDATVTLVSPTDPTDPGFTSEWYLQAADVLPAWSAGFTGAGISVGVFDPTGNVDFSNPDLTANQGGSYLDTGAPGIDQIGTHATLVAGVIGAADDGEGDVGVAYNSTISSEAITTGTDTTDIMSGALADWSKYDVVNNSWGATQPFADNFDSIDNNQQYFQNAVQNGRNGLGTIIVFSAGNTRTTGGNTNNESNTANPDEITVGGINATSDIGSLQFSGTPFSSPGASILVSAPANNITTTGVDLTNEFGQQSGGTSEVALGTSLAAPIVSGVVAMMLQANPSLGYRDVQQILADTATLVPSTTVAPTTWSYNGATDWNGGGMHVSNDYGFGEVDAAAAVRLAQTWTNVSPSYNYQLSPFLTDDPLSNPEPYSITVPAGGAPTIQDFQVEVQLVDANPGDLTITLTSPTGIVSTLMNQPQNAAMTGTATTPDGVVHPVFEATFDSVQDLGASFAGTWTVSITGSKGASEPGAVTLIGFIPEQITPTTTHIYTDEFGSLSPDPNNGARSTLTDTGAGVTLNASPVSTGMTLDLRPGSTDSMIAGRGLTIAADTTVTTVDGGAGNDTITANDAGDTIVAGTGNDTIKGGAGNDSIVLDGGSDTVDGGGGVNKVVFTSSDTVPDQTWAVSENSLGAIVIDGTNAGYSENATLTRIQTVEIGDSLFDLVGTPVAGGTTNVSTPTDGSPGVIIADGAGNDTLLFANTGTTFWHAGGGSDTATLSAGTTNIYLQGSASQYVQAANASGGLTLTDQVANRNGTKTIIAGAGVGNVIFSDGYLVTVLSQASQIGSLYHQVLGQTATAGELATYEQVLAQGGSLASVQTDIANSPEAAGDINSLYENILDRPAGASGLAAWEPALAASGGSLAAVQADIAYSPEAGGDINALYENILDHPAGAAGVAAWEPALAAPGGSLAAVQADIAYSPEAGGDINTLYENILDHPAGAAGVAAWEPALAAPGGTLTAVQADIAYSPEAGGDINTLYENILDHPAGAAGVAAWEPALVAPGGTLAAVQADIAYSPEAGGDINTLYENILGRPAGASGLAAWEPALATPGGSLAAVQSDIVYSPEAATDIDNIYVEFGGQQSPATLSADTIAGRVQLNAGLSLADLSYQIRFIDSNPTVTNIASNSTQTAAGSSELFQSQLSAVGHSTISGFNPSLDIIDVPQAFTYAGIISGGQQTANGFQINLGGTNSILLAGVNASALVPHDFRFG